MNSKCNNEIITRTKKIHNILTFISGISHLNVIICYNLKPVYKIFCSLLYNEVPVKELPIKSAFFYETTTSPAYELTYIIEFYWLLIGIIIAVSLLIFFSRSCFKIFPIILECSKHSIFRWLFLHKLLFSHPQSNGTRNRPKNICRSPSRSS